MKLEKTQDGKRKLKRRKFEQRETGAKKKKKKKEKIKERIQQF